MIIYLVQHGISELSPEDNKKHLSETGREETILSAEFLSKNNITVSGVFHSGKARTFETAQIYSQCLSLPDPLAIPGMNPADPPDEFISNLTLDRALYVGHLPHIEAVLAGLLGSPEGKSPVKIVNSGILALLKRNDQWQLIWYITPGLL